MASSMPAMQDMPEKMRRCIQNCLECANICHQTIHHCLEMGGKHADPAHIRLLMDCAEACMMSASMMARQSSFHAQHCHLCAEICEACEKSCRKTGDDAQILACADACKQCAKSCREM